MFEKNKSEWTKWISLFTVLTGVVIIYKILDNFGIIANAIKNFLGVISPFLSGILIAYILYVPCRKIEETYSKSKKNKLLRKKARPLSILTVYLIVLILLVILINVILPPVIRSVTDIINNSSLYYEILIEKINEIPDNFLISRESILDTISELEKLDFTNLINKKEVANYVQNAIGMVGGIFDLFVTVIVSIYILNERRKIIDFFGRLLGAIFKQRTYNHINKYFNRTNEIFFKFLASQIIDAVVVGILTSIAMSFLKVRYALLLGFMIGLFNIIPYFGAIIAVIVAGIITLITGGLGQAIWMLVIVTILQQIDANIINPKIVGDSLKISPLLVISAVTIGGAYFGVLGMFLAVPVAAVIKLMVEDFIALRNRRKGLNKLIK